MPAPGHERDPLDFTPGGGPPVSPDLSDQLFAEPERSGARNFERGSLAGADDAQSVLAALRYVRTSHTRIAAGWINEAGNRLESASGEVLDEVAKGLGQAVHRLTSDSDDEAIQLCSSLLTYLIAHREIFGEERLQRIANYRASDQDSTPLHNVALGAQDASLAQQLLSLGADPTLTAKFRLGSKQPWRSLTVPHLLLSNSFTHRSMELFEVVLDALETADIRDDRGSTLLLAAMRALRKPDCVSPEDSAVLLSVLLERKPNPHLVDRAGISPYQFAMLGGDFNLARTTLLLAPLDEAGLGTSYSLLPDNGESQPVALDALLEEIVELSQGFSREVLEEMAELYQEKRDPYHVYLYAYALRHFSADALGRLATHLPTYGPEALTYFLTTFEAEMDRRSGPGRSQDMEAELMLLLNHPADPEFDPARVNAFTRAISSMPRFIEDDTDITITARKVRNWARIGFLTFSFIQLRPDAMRELRDARTGDRLSLLGEFGFEYSGQRHNDLDRTGPNGKIYRGFGTGYILRPGRKRIAYLDPLTDAPSQLDERTYVEVRRAYYMVSHPDHGTLVIRNSSPVFGRNTMYHPAFWSDKGIGAGLTADELFEFRGPHRDSGFHPILKNQINRNQVGLDVDVEFLLGQLEGTLAAYHAWKFDTGYRTAWQTVPTLDKPLMFGGAQSRGFGRLIELASNLHRDSGSGDPWGLAFFPSRMHLPYVPFDGGEGRRVVPLNGEVIEAMRELAARDYGGRALRRTRLIEFFQNAGFNTEGRLVLYKEQGGKHGSAH